MENQIASVRELVKNFNNNILEYVGHKYDEYNTRVDFIDKFFKILGWDVNNDEGLSEDFRDVIREDKVFIEGHSKSPDYAFKYGKQRYFFIEAKKPAVKIKEDNESAFQLRRYGHSAELNLSILTNFKEFAVYDTRIAPNIKDNPAVARIFYCTFEEYEKNWEFIYNLFSKKAIINNSMSRFSTENKAIKGTQPLDKGILNMIENWRKELAENMALKNDINKIRNLNEAVQKIIDRVIFLRIAEDRNTEVYGFLKKLAEQNDIYSELVKYFITSNKKYNSGLFTVVKWIDNLIIDNKVLKSIIADLYYPNPYEFSVLPIEILGQIYEQFLGRTIIFKRKTKYGHTIEVEEKPEVRKAGGVYYTPQYIVDYIVQNTVGKKIEKQTPKQIEKLTILDPACGSGSFLVGAYKYLLSFHLGYYSEKKRIRQSQKEGKIYLAKKDTYRLTIREKRKILISNIYGVDIDQQAVEVTKLSLLLALMEGEIVEALKELYFKSSNEALLPDLSDNIKRGNSLIGSDFFKDKNMSLFDDDQLDEIKCFDWEEQFKNIMKSGGFDCVIGNPPYVRVDTMDIEQKKYIKYKFISASGKYDLYYLFLENSLKKLNSSGALGFIIPNRFTTSDSGKNLRNLIIDNFNNIFINSVSKIKVFKEAKIYPNIVIIKNKIEENIKKLILKETKNVDELYNTKNQFTLSSNDIRKLPYLIFPLNSNFNILRLFFKFSNFKRTKEILSIQEGLRIPDEFEKNSGDYHIVKQFQFSRYSPMKRGTFVKNSDIKKRISLESKRIKNCFKEKLIFAEDALRIESIFDNSKSICQGGVYFATKLDTNPINLKYLLGLFNSNLFTTLYKSLFSGMHMGGGYLRFRTSFLNVLPIKTIDFTNKDEKAQHDHMVNLVEQMLEAQKKYNENKTEIMKQRIDILDKQIDSLVYELYGLTEEEIKIVEGE